ncbi:hypothetical protein SAMN05421541_111239 [Actinoplanes philippinensis]|uniref:Uncharacterized protein n=1 Tax=Actinoplanes philippinensis TaxID=35752 RepID=A0A1I2J4T1_9ACTN|nr:hypothetical protein SAMN05421541_111239 [Actinoplanes philippinensis]
MSVEKLPPSFVLPTSPAAPASRPRSAPSKITKGGSPLTAAEKHINSKQRQTAKLSESPADAPDHNKQPRQARPQATGNGPPAGPQDARAAGDSHARQALPAMPGAAAARTTDTPVRTNGGRGSRRGPKAAAEQEPLAPTRRASGRQGLGITDEDEDEDEDETRANATPKKRKKTRGRRDRPERKGEATRSNTPPTKPGRTRGRRNPAEREDDETRPKPKAREPAGRGAKNPPRAKRKPAKASKQQRLEARPEAKARRYDRAREQEAS